MNLWFWIVEVFLFCSIVYFVLLLFVFVYYIFVKGFGLFISKGIVDLHEGEIRVFSKGEGTGCTFIVDLPMTRKRNPSEMVNNARSRSTHEPVVEPIVAVNHMRRQSTRERIVGMLSGKNGHRRHSTFPPTLFPAPQVATNQTFSKKSLQSLNRRHSSPFNHRPSESFNQRFTSPMVTDDPVPLSHRFDSFFPNQGEVRSGGSVMNIGRHSFLDFTEHDRTTRQAEVTALLLKELTARRNFPTRNPEGGDASGVGLIMSPLLLRSEHKNDDAVVAVGSDTAADPPSQQVRPAVTTVATSSPVPVPVPSPVQESAPLPISAPSSPRKSLEQSQNERLPPQGPVYHILVADDSTMTRKMLMKTLRSEGLVHPRRHVIHPRTLLARPINTLNPQTQHTDLLRPLNFTTCEP